MREKNDRRLIFARYFLPPVLLLLVLGLSFIPCYRFTVNGNAEEAVSAGELVLNSFSKAREALFLNGNAKDADIAFSRSVLIWQGILCLLSLAGFSAAAYGAVSAWVCYGGGREESAQSWRDVFSVIFPNRALMLGCELFSLALPLFPYILPWIYNYSYSDTHVAVSLCGPDPLIFTSLVLAASLTLTILSIRAENSYDNNIFAKRKPFTYAPEDEEEKEAKTAPKASAVSMSESERKNKNEKIRRLFENQDKKQ